MFQSYLKSCVFGTEMSIEAIKAQLKPVFSDDFFASEEFLLLEKKVKFIPRMR